MATNNRVPLSPFTEEPEQPRIGRARHRAVVASCFLLVTGTAIVFTVLLARNRLVLFANATASVVSTSTTLDPAAQSMPTIQSTAVAQALPPIATDASPGDKTDAPAGDKMAGLGAKASETELRESQTEALLKEFRAWAVEEDARAKVQHAESVQPLEPLRNARAQDDVEIARAEVRPAQKHRHIRSQHNVRTQARSLKNARAQVQSERKVRQARSQDNAQEMRNDRVQGPPEQTGRNTPAREQSAENAWSLWPHRVFGWLHETSTPRAVPSVQRPPLDR